MVRSAFSAELNGLVDSTEQMVLLQCTLHQIYQAIAQSPERMIDMLEIGQLHRPLELCVDARAGYDAIGASDVCGPAGCSLELHLTLVRDRRSHGLIPRFYWVDARDMLADGLTKGGRGIGRFLLHAVSNGRKHEATHPPFSHTARSALLPNLRARGRT